MLNKKIFLFFSDLHAGKWSGCEELWTQTALELHQRGHAVFFLYESGYLQPSQIVRLVERGVCLIPWKVWQPTLVERTIGRLTGSLAARKSSQVPHEALNHITNLSPDLVVYNQIDTFKGLRWMEALAGTDLPFVTILQNWNEADWPNDNEAIRHYETYQKALRTYVVASRIGEALEERFVGHPFTTWRLVRNPYCVSYDQMFSWPKQNTKLQLACVGRLAPDSKAQDLILKAMAQESLLNLPLHITFFGAGPCERTLNHLAIRLGVQDRITFAGHVDNVQQIWEQHHALLLPSRHEGLPLAMVEAMMCHRPVLVTDIGDHSQFVKDWRTGFLIESATVAATSRALHNLFEAKDNLQEMGRLAGQRVRDLVPSRPDCVFADCLLNLLNDN